MYLPMYRFLQAVCLVFWECPRVACVTRQGGAWQRQGRASSAQHAIHTFGQRMRM